MEQDGTLTEPTSTFQQLNRNPDSVTHMIHSLCCEQFHVGTIFPQQNYTCSPYRCTAGSSIHSDWQRRMSNINDVTVRGSIHSVGGEEFHFLYSDNQTFRKDVSWVYVPNLFRLNFLFLSRLSSVLTLWFGSGTKTSLFVDQIDSSLDLFVFDTGPWTPRGPELSFTSSACHISSADIYISFYRKWATQQTLSYHQFVWWTMDSERRWWWMFLELRLICVGDKSAVNFRVII